MKKIVRLAMSLVAVIALSQTALALSDAEYRQLMKNSDFATADKALNEAWKEARTKMTPEGFKALQSEQRDWVARGRDKEAKMLIGAKMEKASAYASVIDGRSEAVKNKIDIDFLTHHREGPQGYYLDRNGQSLKVFLPESGSDKLRLVYDGFFKTGPDMVNTGNFEGHGVLKGDSVDFLADQSDPKEGSILTVVFKNGTATVTTTSEFKASGYFGHNVTADGVYKRQ